MMTRNSPAPAPVPHNDDGRPSTHPQPCETLLAGWIMDNVDKNHHGDRRPTTAKRGRGTMLTTLQYISIISRKPSKGNKIRVCLVPTSQTCKFCYSDDEDENDPFDVDTNMDIKVAKHDMATIKAVLVTCSHPGDVVGKVMAKKLHISWLSAFRHQTLGPYTVG